MLEEMSERVGSVHRTLTAGSAARQLEQDSLNFLIYAQNHAPKDPEELYFFSDIAPAASTSPGTAAQALYHVLTLATRKMIKVKQDEPFGEIAIEIPRDSGEVGA